MIAIVLKGLSGSVWVAMTCSTSLVPMPNAIAPNAPWVEVWLVAADDGDARHREPELRADDVDDALLLVAERVQAHAELLGVAAQRLDLGAAGQVGDRLVDVERRGVVILGRDREVEAPQRPALGAQAVERLRARDLVHEVQVDVDEVGLAVLALDDQMVVPHLLGEGARAIGMQGSSDVLMCLVLLGKGIKPATNSATRKA